jgi:hypothetical protein
MVRMQWVRPDLSYAAGRAVMALMMAMLSIVAFAAPASAAECRRGPQAAGYTFEQGVPGTDRIRGHAWAGFVQGPQVIRVEGPGDPTYWKTVNGRWWGRSVRYDLYLVSWNPYSVIQVYSC